MPAAAQAAITLPRTVATLPRLGYGSTCFRADLQVFSSGYPQHASPPPGCSFSAPSRHARYVNTVPVEGVLA
ncbi:MAG: hypothetical protein J6Q22_16985 [Prevotella sp.]|nr:hypothetical protein [Prevotella sp.]